MINGGAIGEVGIHVAEGDAVGVIGRGRHRVAFRIEPRQGSEQGLRLRYTVGIAVQIAGHRNGGVESTGPEEIHEGGVDVRERSAYGVASADRERASGGS